MVIGLTPGQAKKEKKKEPDDCQANGVLLRGAVCGCNVIGEVEVYSWHTSPSSWLHEHVGKASPHYPLALSTHSALAFFLLQCFAASANTARNLTQDLARNTASSPAACHQQVENYLREQ